jgi:hypothetical protein
MVVSTIGIIAQVMLSGSKRGFAHRSAVNWLVTELPHSRWLFTAFLLLRSPLCRSALTDEYLPGPLQ